MNPDQNNQPEQPEQPQTFEAPQPVVQNDPVTPTPVADPFGAAPVATDAPVANPAPQPPKKSNKKLIIILSSVIGGLILLAGAAVAAYLILFTASKDDYQQAYSQLKVVSDQVNDTSALSTKTDTDAIEKFQAKYDEFKASSAKLKDYKAIRVDGDVNKKFVAYNNKVTEYTAFMDTFIPSIKEYVDLSSKVDDLTSSSVSVKRYEDTIEILDNAKEISNPFVKTLIDDYKKTYKDMLPQVKIYNSTTSTTSERLAAVTKLSAYAKDLTAAAATFKKDVEAKRDETSPKNEFNALKKEIETKLNK